MLRFSSCQAENAEAFCAAVTAFIGERLGISAEFVGDVPWQERERMLDRGEIHVCWICGLPYVRKRDQGVAGINLLAAPVMKHPRYNGRPVYYSDVVVHAASGFQSVDDLRSATWAYNEPGSHSGHNLLRYHVRDFGRIVESGSHQSSLQMILDFSIDAAALDSTVLETEVLRNPSIVGTLRTIAVLGPSPAPPWVVHRSVPIELQEKIGQLFLSMHEDAHGRALMDAAGVLRFAPVADSDYDSIREVDSAVGAVYDRAQSGKFEDRARS